MWQNKGEKRNSKPPTLVEWGGGKKKRRARERGVLIFLGRYNFLVAWVFKYSRLFCAQHPVKHICIVCLKKTQETVYTTQKLQMLQHTRVEIYEPHHPVFPCGSTSCGGCLLNLCSSEIKNRRNSMTSSQTLSLITEHHLFRARQVTHGPLTNPSAQLVVAAQPSPRWFWGPRFRGSVCHQGFPGNLA